MQYIKDNLLSIIALILLLCILTIGLYLYNKKQNTQLKDSTVNIEQNISNNTIEITNTSEDLSYAAAKGLRSAVSVYCSFTSNAVSSWPWGSQAAKSYYSVGSGVIYDIDENGNAFIITNYHVVYDSDCNTQNKISDKIRVYLYGRENESYEIEAQYIGGSANYDIAVLFVEKSTVLADAYASGSAAKIELASSDATSAGDVAIAIGNPSSSDVSGISVTKGIVSVESEYITMTGVNEKSEVTFRVIRVDTPINSGNSGGGLFDARGNLIGIVNAKIASTNIENIGYAIPSNVVRAVADNIIDYCYNDDYTGVMRCMLGITMQTTALDTHYDAESGKLYKVEEISVGKISSGSLADGKLQVGDIIKSITICQNTVSVTHQYHITDTMLDARPQDTITLLIDRDGTEISVSITIGEDNLTEY